jgi:hypothetical protein
MSTGNDPAAALAERIKTYRQLSLDIGGMDDAQLRALLNSSETIGGWGKHQTIEIGGRSVFVKRVQITDLEYEAAFSTRNLYDLPLYYQYGVGSAGFGVFRELAMHVKTTEWVLDGAIANFPLMYNHRIMPLSNDGATVNEKRVASYVTYWGGAENVGRFWRGRVHASHELVVFMEHFQFVLDRWLVANPSRLPETLGELRRTIDFLRVHDVIHFDAHYNNIVTDGVRPYLTDFGLALDRGFELTEDERVFFDGHTHYDYGEVLWNAGYLLVAAYNALSDEDRLLIRTKLGLAESHPIADHLLRPLVNNVEALADEPALSLHPALVAAAMRYREIIMLVQTFFVSLRANPRKDTPCPHAELRRLLREAGFAD